MAVITFPSVARITKRQWLLNVPQQINRSGFTGRRRVVGLPGSETWHLSAAVEPLTTERQARAWRAFLSALRGAESSFRMQALPTKQIGFANPLVTAPVIGNRAVAVNSTAGIEIGMMATVHQNDGFERMVVVVGIAAPQIHFEPYLIFDPLIGAPMEFQYPWAVMSLTGGDQGGWDDTNGITAISFTAEEAL